MMAWWNVVLSRFGIGLPKMTLDVPQQPIAAGGTLEGKLILRGGTFPQRLQHCDIRLYTAYTRHYTDARGQQRAATANALLQSYTIDCDTRLGPGESREIDLLLLLPAHTPPMLFREQVWLEARLHTDRAAGRKQRQPLRVLPAPLLQRALQSMELLGFTLVKSFMTANSEEERSPDPYVQQLVYRVSSTYREFLDEIILIPAWYEESLRLHLDINRKSGLLQTIAGKDIVSETVDLPLAEWESSDDAALTRLLKETIDRSAHLSAKDLV